MKTPIKKIIRYPKLPEMEIPTGCHECHHLNVAAGHWCIEVNSRSANVGSHVKNKTYHPDCPYKEEWEMKNKLSQL